MTTLQTDALLVAMKEFHHDYEADTNIWLDYDHIPERLSCPGMEWCERLELHPLRPAGWTPDQAWLKYLTFYGLASVDVLQSPPYKLQKKINGGKGSLMRQLRNVRRKGTHAAPDRSLRTIWVRKAGPFRSNPEVEHPAPRTCLVQFRNPLGAMEDPVNRLIDDQLVPELMSLPGFLGCERWQAGVADLAKHSEPPLMHPMSMDIFDVSTPEILVSGIYRKFIASLDSLTPELRAAWQPDASGIYSQRPSPWRITLK